jgi:uncharacterized protein (TIGR02147 family)
MPASNSDIAILQTKYHEMLERNPRLSKRAFAAKMGLSSGALTEILKGRRPLSLKQKMKLLPKLDLSPKEKTEFLGEQITTAMSTDVQDASLKLTEDQFRMIGDWWHYALLNLLKTKDFKFDFLWMSKRLRLPEKSLFEAWQRLLRLGHIVKKEGRFFRRYPNLSTPDNVISQSLRRSHLEDLKLIERALIEVDPGERDVVSMTVGICLKDIPAAKKLIREFQDRFSDLVSDKNPEEIYKLSISFYPLTFKSTGESSDEAH